MAPRETIEPAARVMLLFMNVVGDAVGAGVITDVLTDASAARLPTPTRLESQLRTVAAEFAGRSA